MPDVSGGHMEWCFVGRRRKSSVQTGLGQCVITPATAGMGSGAAPCFWSLKKEIPCTKKKAQSVLWILWVRSEPSVVGDFLSSLSEENKCSDMSSGRWCGAGAARSPACFCALHSPCVPWDKSSTGEGILGHVLCKRSLFWRCFVIICAKPVHWVKWWSSNFHVGLVRRALAMALLYFPSLVQGDPLQASSSWIFVCTN